MRISSIGLASSLPDEPSQARAVARALTIDSPLSRRNDSTLGVTRMLGKAINNPKLAQLQPGQNTSPVVTRANNLASLTAAMLLQLQPNKRTDALIKIGGLNYAQHVLSFTEANPAKLDITEALRFSLALNFMLGMLDHQAGKSTFLADGYVCFARLFKDAQDKRAGRPVGVGAQRAGLSGLGQVPKIGPGGKASLVRIDVPIAKVVPKFVLPPAFKQKTSVEAEGYIPPPSPDVDWNSVGQPKPLPPQEIVSRKNGRCIQWSPKDPCYPAPDDKPEVNLVLVQADACGIMTAGGDPLASLDTKRRNKLAGVRKAFADVFGRYPNNTEAEYYGSMQWCASTDPNDQMVALKSRMIAVRDAIKAGTPTLAGPMNTTPLPTAAGPTTPNDFKARTAFTDIGDSIAYAAAQAFDFLGKVAQGISDILCAGFKALFGDAVGGVLCDIIRFFTNMMVSSVAAIVDIVIESLKGTFEFIKLMVDGKVEAAFTALLQSMGRVIFSLSAPMMVPILMADKGRVIGTRPNGTPIYEKAEGPSMAAAFAELKVRADRVTKKEPLWPIMVVMAVVGVFSAIGGNVLGAITGLVTALAPMVATFISEPLQRNIRELAAESLETIEAGIGKFIKFALLIFQGAMSIKSIIAQFRAQLVSYFKGANAGSLTGDTKDENGNVKKANPATRIKYVLEKFTAGINVITAAFKDFNVKDIMKSAGPLLMLIPDLLLAILPDDAKTAMPSLTEWKDAVKQSETDVNKQEKALRAGAADIFKTFSLGAKVSFVQDTMKEPELQTPANAAAIAAQVYAQQFKNQSTYPQFVAAFRAELLKA